MGRAVRSTGVVLEVLHVRVVDLIHSYGVRCWIINAAGRLGYRKELTWNNYEA